MTEALIIAQEKSIHQYNTLKNGMHVIKQADRAWYRGFKRFIIENRNNDDSMLADPYVRKVINGVIYGTVREMRADGLGDLASAVIKESRKV